MKRLVKPFVFIILCCWLCAALLCGCREKQEPWPDIHPPHESDPSQQTENTDLPSLRELPEIYIRTKDNAEITSKDTYVDCAVGLMARTQESATWYNAQIRLRGNTSAMVEKKPYRIKFEEKIMPFGLGDGKAKSWVLLAEYVDYSMVRNYSVFDFANRVYGEDYFCPDAMFVSVYLNNQYQGMYLLTEQIQINDNRISIPETASIPEQYGYLLELEQAEIRREDAVEGLDCFHVVNPWYGKTYFMIKNNDCNEEMNRYIRAYVQKVYNAVGKGDYSAICELVDVESAARAYLVQMVGDDPDSNLASMFFYKAPNGKFTFGPPWDFDFAMGNYFSLYQPEKTVINTLLERLGQVPQIHQRVCELWAEYRGSGYFDAFFAHLDSEVTRLRPEIDRNYERWPVWGTRVAQWQAPQTESFENYDDAYRDFVQWYRARIAYLDTVFVME